MPSSHLILCRPLLLLLPIPPSIKVFSSEATLRMRWPKYWSFSFSNIPSKEHPGLISFRMDCLGLLAVQGTLRSLLQHHSSKASILQHSAFFTESPLDCKEIQPVHSEGEQPWDSLEGMMLKLKLQYFGQLVRRVDSLEKTLMLGGIGSRRRRG